MPTTCEWLPCQPRSMLKVHVLFPFLNGCFVQIHVDGRVFGFSQRQVLSGMDLLSLSMRSILARIEPSAILCPLQVHVNWVSFFTFSCSFMVSVLAHPVPCWWHLRVCVDADGIAFWFVWLCVLACCRCFKPGTFCLAWICFGIRCVANWSGLSRPPFCPLGKCMEIVFCRPSCQCMVPAFLRPIRVWWHIFVCLVASGMAFGLSGFGGLRATIFIVSNASSCSGMMVICVSRFGCS